MRFAGISAGTFDLLGLKDLDILDRISLLAVFQNQAVHHHFGLGEGFVCGHNKVIGCLLV
jgi:hypothetical protein